MTGDELRERLKLTLVISRAEAAPRGLAELIEAAFDGGVTALQLREKNMADRLLYEQALALKEICRRRGRLLIINDRLDLALAVGADGVHLGQSDLPAEIAARLLPKEKILGISAATAEEARRSLAGGADYLGVGALFPTGSKDDAEVAQAAEVRSILALGVPTVAIGGLRADNAAEAWRLGFSGLAVISALAAADDPQRAAEALLAAQGF